MCAIITWRLYHNQFMARWVEAQRHNLSFDMCSNLNLPEPNMNAQMTELLTTVQLSVNFHLHMYHLVQGFSASGYWYIFSTGYTLNVQMKWVPEPLVNQTNVSLWGAATLLLKWHNHYKHSVWENVGRVLVIRRLKNWKTLQDFKNFFDTWVVTLRL